MMTTIEILQLIVPICFGAFLEIYSIITHAINFLKNKSMSATAIAAGAFFCMPLFMHIPMI